MEFLKTNLEIWNEADWNKILSYFINETDILYINWGSWLMYFLFIFYYFEYLLLVVSDF